MNPTPSATAIAAACLACVLAFVVGGACSTERNTVVASASRSRSADDAASGVDAPQPADRLRSRVAAWIASELPSATPLNNPPRPIGDVETAKALGLVFRYEPEDKWETSRMLNQEEVCLFINAGPTAIPLLMRHIHNASPSHIAFMHPRCSQFPRETMLIGEIACYMIEAALRGETCFKIVPELPYTYSSIGGPTKEEQRRAALERAAAEYERWYAACFDESACVVTCPPNRGPQVDWCHYLGSWGACAITRIDSIGFLQEVGRDRKSGRIP